MRTLIVASLCMAVAGLAAAQGDPNRQGGDGVWDATVVPGLPYFAEGTTEGYADDYDASCALGADAPDVVYVYTPAADGAISIDSCGSAFNTVLYVFDFDANLLGCNNDRPGGGSCGASTSLLEPIDVEASLSYFIVVDGGTGDGAGQYELLITEYQPYEFTPPWYAQPENEPPLVEGYVDNYNGGCESEVFEYQFHPFDPAFGYDASLHGRSGWYADSAGLTRRDTDWFLVDIYAQGELNLTIEATEACRVYWFEVGSTCDEPILGGSMAVSPGHVSQMAIQGPYASSIRVKVLPLYPDPPGGEYHEFEYLLGVRWGDGWECPFPTPLGDECVDAAMVSHARNLITAPIDDFVDDHSPEGVCAESAAVDNDGLVQVYLYAGQRLQVGWIDVWYPQPAGGDDRYVDVCFYLVTDARLTPGSCVDADCGEYRQWGFGHTFTAPTSAWYYLICDLDANEGTYFAGANLTFPDETPYISPPPPPPGDGCDSAPLIAPGPFTFVGDLDLATNQFDPGRDGCLDDPNLHWTGGDMVFRVDLQAGDRLTAVLTPTGGWDAAMYLVANCEEPLGSCVASGLHLEHVALEDQTLWLVCDSWGIGPRPFLLAGVIDSVTPSPAPAARAGLRSIQPNPCNPATIIEYALDRPGRVVLAVYDLRGRLVHSLATGVQDAGHHRVRWNGVDAGGREVASGVYVVRLETSGRIQTRSLTVLR